uniref:Candidate secreted effector n=1 Tax=Meloidogyne incognita TaxID=6306 RepID=A0A914LTT0_MELIC
MNWANMQYTQSKNFSGADNGALQLHILQTVIPSAKAEIKACKKLWNLANNYERYMGYVTCVKTALGATRIWPGKLRILRRGHGWIRDWFLTTDSWSARDFMLHGWKSQNISSSWESPFKKVPVPDECIGGYAGWNWRTEKAKEFFLIFLFLLLFF